jgi:hypothetical protein
MTRIGRGEFCWRLRSQAAMEAMDTVRELDRQGRLLPLSCSYPAAACRPRRRAPLGATLGSRR